MAITTLDGVIAGAEPPQFYFKAISPTLVQGRPFSPFYLAGIPGAAVAPTPGLSGAALTTYSGQIPWSNPTGGNNSYLSRFGGNASNVSGSLLLCDRLWHNSGITITSTGSQTVNSVAFPARDNNGATDGEGILLGVEVSTQTGSGTPTITVGYTNSAGTSGRTATNTHATTATSVVGSFYPISLQAGDLGVRSIQSLTLSATWTSGTIHLVAYRVLAAVDIMGGAVFSCVDAITGGFPRLYDNTVPFVLLIAGGTTASNIVASMTVTQG